MKKLNKLFLISAIFFVSHSLMYGQKMEQERDGYVKVDGVWKVKAQRIEGVLTNIGIPSRPEFANYGDISIVIPDIVSGNIKGNNFYHAIRFKFEIEKHQQIRIFRYGGYVDNQLMIGLGQNVDVEDFASYYSYMGIFQIRNLIDNFNWWLFGTDGTVDLDVIINVLSQEDNVSSISYNSSSIMFPCIQTTSFRDNMFNVVKFNISNSELIFMDSRDNPIIVFIKEN